MGRAARRLDCEALPSRDLAIVVSLPLTGYVIHSLLRESPRTRVYEVTRKRDGARLIAKVFEAIEPSSEARVEHEFRVLQELDSDGVVRALGVERAGRQLVLLLEHVRGEDLGQLTGGQPLTLARALPLASEAARILAQIHACRIVHRDIKPSNILVEAGTGRVVFIDFGISVLLEHERRFLYDPAVLEGTLPYISPEQTGRTRREVDFRSDLYSLGVTLYQLLTGQRPFSGKAPLELVHAHLAQRPRTPHELVPSIPRVLSAIVMKLLEKAPEHRYQSARGLHADLERLAAALQRGEPEPDFPLAEHDFATTLQLPHQLYGRAREREALADELVLALEQAEPRLMLIGGPAGSGKSSLIGELEAKLCMHGGYVGIGKFEQRESEGRAEPQPYRGVAQALHGVLEQILCESDERLAAWRVALREALGPLAGVVATLLPELSLIVGELAPVPEVELGEARNRLHLALGRLVSALAQRAPLVLVLDDLQWSDAGSLELLDALVGGLARGSVLFIGAFRSEAFDVDALLPRANKRVLTLAPLTQSDLEQLLADVLGRPRDEVAPLAQVIGRKTANNQLFVRQYLVQLAELGLLRPGQRAWEWELPAIVEATLPDDLVGIMASKIERLPERERQVLELAACIGARFEVDVLATIAELASEELAASLYALESHALIVRVGALYHFSHDRIQEAARARLPEPLRRRVHWRIGQELLARAGEQASDELLFALVEQLDQGLDDPARLSEQEVEQLVELNIEAGERALKSAAWRAALRYFEVATTLYPSDRRDASSFAAQFGLAQSLALAGETEAAEQAFERLLGWQLSLVDRARVVARQVHILRLQDRQALSVEYGLAGLEACGFRIPAKPSVGRMLMEILLAWRAVAGVDLDRLMQLPDAQDERTVAAMHIVSAMKWSAFAIDAQLYMLLAALHVRLVMREGYHPTAPDGLGQLAFAGLAMKRIPAAHRLGEAVVELSKRRASAPAAAISAESVQLMYVGPTAQPLVDFIDPLEQLCERALELGDRLYAGYLAAVHLILCWESDTHLSELLELEQRLRRDTAGFGARESDVLAVMIRDFAQVLGREDPDPDQTQDPDRDPDRDPAQAPSFLVGDALADAAISQVSRYAATSIAALGHLLLGEHERARALADSIAHDYEQVLVGFWIVPRFATVDAIVASEAARQDPRQRRPMLRRLRKRIATLQRFAAVCPANYAAMLELARAELAWLRGRTNEAFAGFERARALAVDHRRTYVEALAGLRLVALADQLDWSAARDGALRCARDTLTRWGAWAAVRRLDRSYGIVPALVASSERTTSHSSESSSASELPSEWVASLDLASVLGTLQAIGEDLRLEHVITRVLGGAIENAGADRGLLLLERAGTIAVVAEGDANDTHARLDQPLSLRDASDRLPSAVVNFVLRTGEAVVLDEARDDPRFVGDDYITQAGVRSILCMAIVKHEQRIGALLLENHLSSGAFTRQRLETLGLLLAQAASALDNARLYAQLEHSEAQWRSLVDGVPDIIALVDAQARTEFINRADALGSDPASLVGQPADAALDPDSAEAWRAALASVVETGESRELEVSVTLPDGQRRWFMTRLCPITLSGRGEQRAERYLSIATDVTARKNLEAQLRQQQRLESVGTLASGVAHEINNPIQGIMNYAELISDQPHEVEAVLDYTGEVMREAQRVADIVRNLLAFARKDAEQELDRRATADLIEDTLSLVRTVLRKDQIALDLDVPRSLPALICRAQQVQQIVMNLVTNARDALNERFAEPDERKRIRIRAHTFERDRRPWVRISVQDQGTGIPEALRGRIFDPFFTTKGRDQGTGLGLALSHRIAVDHGGDLWVESEPGVGSSFHLELPAAQ